MPNISINVDIEDILFRMSHEEKIELYEELVEELDKPYTIPSIRLSVGGVPTSMELEIQSTLSGIWEKRLLLTPAQRQTLTDVLNTSNI